MESDHNSYFRDNSDSCFLYRVSYKLEEYPVTQIKKPFFSSHEKLLLYLCFVFFMFIIAWAIGRWVGYEQGKQYAYAVCRLSIATAQMPITMVS